MQELYRNEWDYQDSKWHALIHGYIKPNRFENKMMETQKLSLYPKRYHQYMKRLQFIWHHIGKDLCIIEINIICYTRLFPVYLHPCKRNLKNIVLLNHWIHLMKQYTNKQII